MDQEQKELTIEESVNETMDALPSFIREYIAQGKYSLEAGRLVSMYRLHVDQGTILEREILLLLMGIETPAEFIQSLIEEARIEQSVVSSIIQDVNAKIFLPLREEMRRDGSTTKRIAPAALVQSAPPSRSAQASVPRYVPPGHFAPPLQSPRYPRDVQSVPRSSVAPLPPKTVMPRSAETRQSMSEKESSAQLVSAEMQSQSQRQQNETQITLHPEELPVGEVSAPSVTPPPSTSDTVLSPPPSSSSAPAPRSVEPPPAAVNRPVRPSPLSSPPPSRPSTPPARPPYSQDPYREPV